jgi:hypothetical protein
MSYRGADGLGLLVELLDDQLWSEVELVDEKFIRLLHNDPERVDRTGRKVSNVEGYDRICAGFRGGREDVSVAGVVEHRVDQVRVTLDSRLRKCVLNSVYQAINLGLGQTEIRAFQRTCRFFQNLCRP